MAPHRRFADPLRAKVGEPLKVSQVEQSTLQYGKRPKVMRCTSVNYSEEEESKDICFDETDYLRSTTYRKKPWWVSAAVWPGISPLLDATDQGQKKLKNKEDKIALETEDRKKAVENDDQTESLAFESTTLGCPRPAKDENPWIACTLDLPSKDFNRGKPELDNPSNILLIPFPIQETTVAIQTDNVTPRAQTLLSETDRCEVEELAGKDETDSQEDVAHVQLNEDVKIMIVSRKRHAVRKVKRNCWEVTDPDLPCKKKRTCREVQIRKAKKTKAVTHNKPPASVEDIDKIIAQFTETDKLLKETLPPGITFKQMCSSVNTEPKDSDSGVHSQNNNDGTTAAQGNSGGSGGSSTEEEGSRKHSGGNGGDGGDDGKDEKNKVPWWCFPGGENAVAQVKKKKKEEERKKMEESREERMDLNAPDMSRFQFLPSQIDQREQCHLAGNDMSMATDFVTDTGMLDFLPQDLQHSCYCSRKGCDVNLKCKAVKEELKHMGEHKKCLTCVRCKNTHNIVKQHATLCKRSGCRVPDCNQFRNGWIGQPVKHGPPLQVKIPMLDPLGPRWARPPIITKPRIPATDGRVIFRNSTILPDFHFSEHIDYHVQRRKKLGEGSNGDIYKIIVQADRNLEWVVKETKYEMPLEEIEVYKAVGFHQHIVKIFGATFHGSSGKINLFMEKCDQSLYDYISAKGSRLPVDEAMFYWLQVLDAVHYLHNLPVPVIHKDIKAKNVVLTCEYSRAKLCDMDSAIRLPDELTEAGLKPLGTKGFVAPEVIEKKRHGRPADIYSLACLLIEETVGVPSADTLDDKIDQLRQLDHELAELVTHCTKTRPEDRPTAGQLVQCPALQKFRQWQRR